MRYSLMVQDSSRSVKFQVRASRPKLSDLSEFIRELLENEKWYVWDSLRKKGLEPNEVQTILAS